MTADDIVRELDKSLKKNGKENTYNYVDTVLTELVGAGIKSSVGITSKEDFQNDLFENRDKILGTIIHTVKDEYRALYIGILQLVDEAGQGNYKNIMEFVGENK